MIDPEKIMCLICNKEFHNLSAHIKIHNIQRKDYANLFPNAPFYSKITGENLSRAATKRVESEEARQVIRVATKVGMDKPEIKRKMREAKIGKPLSEIHKSHLRGIPRKPRTITELYLLSRLEVANRPEAIEKARLKSIRQANDLDNNWGKGWKIRRNESYPERAFREMLESFGYTKNIDFFQEYRVWRYSLDFAVLSNSLKLDIEVDGAQHFTMQGRIDSDMKRDAFLRQNGWEVLRIKAKDIVNHTVDSKEIMFIRKSMGTTGD